MDLEDAELHISTSISKIRNAVVYSKIIENLVCGIPMVQLMKPGFVTIG